MDKLRAMELFVRVADLGSFTAVAEERNTSKSTISKELRRLEEDIGARLLYRSTRRLQLTQVGEGYLQRCRRILLEVGDAHSFVQDLQKNPRGKLRINAPMTLGITDLSRAFADFMRCYPDIELDIELSDDAVDLIEHGFDVGFRVASREFDSSYIGRPLTRFSYAIVCSHKYLKDAPPLKTPADLVHHRCFIYSYFRGKNLWPIDDGIAVSGPLKVNNTLFMIELIKAGLGIGFIPEFACKKELESGEVIALFPSSKRPQLTLYALYPARHHMPSSLRLCIGFLEKWFSGHSTNNPTLD